ncbi:flavodoxin family protein [Phytomonospora endophytica]|uniref:Multimeric flavodoxin WrbA n=1 Tax=Phytomonospora endophytica TaxID=714109 RepID=A0A841FH28_9ACTN|nr:flavodoxin family protein [Phytomonospora endophytica]MBB6035015.1 multimeric flavodoxin WrbA [Phytomonospora endophytica]GIG68269.1 FMN reductase [Phytomonospora endophytica]
MNGTIRVAIAYHSAAGHTHRLAEHVRDGALTVPGTEARLVPVETLDDGLWDTLASADAIIFGSPTYMGAASATFQAFAEASSAVWAVRGWQDKLAAGFTASGGMSGDKLNTLQQMTILAAQHGMNWVNLGLGPGWHMTYGTEFDRNRLGFYLGAAAQTFNDLPAEDMNPGDLATGAALGARVAEAARVVRAGRLELAVAG